MTMRLIYRVLLLAGIIAAPLSALAEMKTYAGVGRAPVVEDLMQTRSAAVESAKRDAVTAAVRSLNGSTANLDPKVQAELDNIVKQLPDDALSIVEQRKEGNQFVVKISLQIDDLQIRQLLRDTGIADTSARLAPIMIIMDEYFTQPTNMKAPLREVVEYSHDKSSSASEAASEESYARESSAETSRSNTAHASDTAVVAQNGWGGAAAGRHQAVRRDQRESASASESEAGASNSYASSAEQKDIVHFKSLVEYQPRNIGPEKQSYTYTALLESAASYDLNVLDNSKFKSQFFRGKPMTMEEMESGSMLAQFVDEARDVARADYIMYGTSVIVDNGKDASLGKYVCDGLISLKTYATEGGEVIAAETRGESAAGNSPDDCRTQVAAKLAYYTGSTVGHKIHDYARNRAVSGRQYFVSLVSALGKLNLKNRRMFVQSLQQLKGLQSKIEAPRGADQYKMEITLTYKGEDVIGEIADILGNVEGFENVDAVSTGNKVTFCLEGACPKK